MNSLGHCSSRGAGNSGAEESSFAPLPQTHRTRQSKRVAIDLFAGAGGLSLGFRHAGFDVIAAIEKNSAAAKTYSRNHPDSTLIESDIEEVDPYDCMRTIGVRPGEVTAIVGGLPCQGFSDSNRRTRTFDNPRNHLYTFLLNFVSVVQPQWVIVENVAGLRTTAQGRILRQVIEGLVAGGYVAEWRVLNAADFGVPQLRRRLFILANRIGAVVPVIANTHGPGHEPWLVVRDAISDLPILSNGANIDELPYNETHELSAYQVLMRQNIEGTGRVTGNLVTRNASYVMERYPHIPQGGNWKDIPEELLTNYQDFTRCHTGIYHRLTWDAPSKVIGNFRKNMLIHPDQHRGLSVREAARLQSFPDNYTFVGSIGLQQQQVADAVPPLLAQAVARTVLRAHQAVRDSLDERRYYLPQACKFRVGHTP